MAIKRREVISVIIGAGAENGSLGHCWRRRRSCSEGGVAQQLCLIITIAIMQSALSAKLLRGMPCLCWRNASSRLAKRRRQAA